MSTQLVHFDAARRALAEAHRIDEVKQIRDQAEALRQYIRQQKGSFEMQNQAAEIKLRAERRAGQMLKQRDMALGGQPYQNSSTGLLIKPVETLTDLGISKFQSHRWQLEAEIPEEQFEGFITETKAAADELTSRAAYALAKKLQYEEKKKATSDPITPEGLFDVIVIDPPWPYGRDYNTYGSRVANPYEEISLDDLTILEIPAANDCILWLWTTNTFMHDAYHLLEAWAFEPKTILTWYKERTGVGHYLRGDTEHCLLALRGSPSITHVAQSSFLSAKAGAHSEKPDAFYKLVESLCPGKRYEMFGRRERGGWTVHGNQLKS